MGYLLRYKHGKRRLLVTSYNKNNMISKFANSSTKSITRYKYGRRFSFKNPVYYGDRSAFPYSGFKYTTYYIKPYYNPSIYQV